jgi:hypothetical protein
METLNTADERKISSFVRELYHLDKIESFSQRVVEGLGRIIRRKQRWHPFSETEIREVHVTEDAASEIKKALLSLVQALAQLRFSIGWPRAKLTKKSASSWAWRPEQ